MAFGLNIFRTVTADLTTSDTELYTAPAGYSAIVLSAQVSNNSASSQTLSMAVLKEDSTETALLTQFAIPANDAVQAIVGKLVLTTGIGITATAGANGVLTCTLSILESKN